MINVNDADESVEIKEVLSFKHHVQRIYDDIRDDLKYDFVENESVSNKKEIESFLKYELTHSDKIAILDKIVDAFESFYEFCDSASIFDEELIKNAVQEWITDNFDIEF